VLPIFPGVGTVSILLVGWLMGGRAAEGVWAQASVEATSRKKQVPRFARNDNTSRNDEKLKRNDEEWRWG
jgi:hypothetical protein